MLRCLALLLMLATAAVAQQASPFMVRVWQSDEGLPGNVVRSLGQTPDGYLWIATAEGIARFDGNEFERIPATGEWRGRPLDYFRIFTPDDGSLWIATNRRGLFRLGKDGLDCVIADFTGSDPGIITRLFTHEGIVYFVRKQKLWRFDGVTPQEVANPSPEVASAAEADQLFQRRRGRADNAVPPERLETRDGHVWTLSNKDLSFQPEAGSGSPSAVTDFTGRMTALDLLEDREGCLWVASPVQGLVRIRHRRVMPLAIRDGTYDSPVLAGIQSRDGTWWIANRSGGVDRIRDGVVHHVPIVTSGLVRPVSCLHEDRAGRLWIASRDASLFKLNPATQLVEGQFTDVPGLSKINTIAEDKDGRLWFGGRLKLYCWDGVSMKTFEGPAPLFQGVDFSTLTFDDDGILYVGTGDGRIFRFDGTEFTLLGNLDALPRRGISTILPLAANELWASTIGAGLLLWKDGRWHRFGKDHGIPDERLTGLALTGEDSLWMGSLGGIVKASRAELLRCATDGKTLPHWLHLDRSDGLTTRECIGWTQPGVTRALDGSLWFPTTGGFAGLQPERIDISPVPPVVHFQPVEINGVTHPAGSDPIVAGPGAARLGFRFNGLSLSAPEKVTYQVQLIGVDDVPRWIGNDREADYPPVPPGRYTFQVSATNGDGVTTLHPAMLPIEIRPHFWQTAWFAAASIAAAVFLPLALGGWIVRRRLKRKLREIHLQGMLEAERSRISRDLHDDLGASLTEVSILSALAAEKNHDEKLRPELDHLSLKAKRVVGALDEIVWATNPTQDSLASLVEYLAFYAREFLKVVNVRLHTDVAREVPDLMIGPRRRHNVVLATREALNNAVKHANPQGVSLRIAIEDTRLVVVIRDDGKGFPVEDAASGDGLANLKKRMTDCGGDCLIESVRGEGSTVTLIVPLTR